MSEVILKVSNLKKSYGKVEALRGISFELKKGEIVGYLGPNGAGKTTTVRILLGLLEADAGKVIFHSIDRNSISFVLEKDGLFEKLSVYENLNFYADFLKVERKKEKINELMELMGIADIARKQVARLSRGQKRRVALARALLNSPKLLILDEPTSGLDPVAQLQLQDIIIDLKKQKSLTVLLASHNLHEVERTCDRVIILRKGEIMYEGLMEEIGDVKGLEKIFREVAGNAQS